MPDAEVTTDPPICPFAACNAADNRDVVGRGRDFLYGTTAEETDIVRCPTCGMLRDETHKSQKKRHSAGEHFDTNHRCTCAPSFVGRSPSGARTSRASMAEGSTSNPTSKS